MYVTTRHVLYPPGASSVSDNMANSSGELPLSQRGCLI